MTMNTERSVEKMIQRTVLVLCGLTVALVVVAAALTDNVFTAHVNVGFFQGASLPDPAHLLQGTGKFMRHVKLRPGTAANTLGLSRLIEMAYSDIKMRVENG